MEQLPILIQQIYDLEKRRQPLEKKIADILNIYCKCPEWINLQSPPEAFCPLCQPIIRPRDPIPYYDVQRVFEMRIVDKFQGFIRSPKGQAWEKKQMEENLQSLDNTKNKDAQERPDGPYQILCAACRFFFPYPDFSGMETAPFGIACGGHIEEKYMQCAEGSLYRGKKFVPKLPVPPWWQGGNMVCDFCIRNLQQRNLLRVAQ